MKRDTDRIEWIGGRFSLRRTTVRTPMGTVPSVKPLALRDGLVPGYPPSAPSLSVVDVPASTLPQLAVSWEQLCWLPKIGQQAQSSAIPCEVMA